MQKIIVFLLFLGYAQVQAQVTIELRGNPNDSTLITKKKRLEAKGYQVTIVEKRDEYVPDIKNSFVKKYLNQSLPEFDLKDIEGNKISSKDLIGKYVHINFWSVTCKPCIEEFPELNQLKREYDKEGDFVFIAIAPEGQKRVLKVLEKHSLNYIVIADAKEFFDKLGIDGYPGNFFINPAGKIVYVRDGSTYKGEKEDGKFVMKPDNFRFYDEAIKRMLYSKD